MRLSASARRSGEPVWMTSSSSGIGEAEAAMTQVHEFDGWNRKRLPSARKLDGILKERLVNGT